MRELLVFFNANWPAGRSTISGKRCSLYTDTTSAIANRRRDFLNKLVSRLIRRYARPGLEDPRITKTRSATITWSRAVSIQLGLPRPSPRPIAQTHTCRGTCPTERYPRWSAAEAADISHLAHLRRVTLTGPDILGFRDHVDRGGGVGLAHRCEIRTEIVGLLSEHLAQVRGILLGNAHVRGIALVNGPTTASGSGKGITLHYAHSCDVALCHVHLPPFDSG